MIITQPQLVQQENKNNGYREIRGIPILLLPRMPNKVTWLTGIELQMLVDPGIRWSRCHNSSEASKHLPVNRHLPVNIKTHEKSW